MLHKLSRASRLMAAVRTAGMAAAVALACAPAWSATSLSFTAQLANASVGQVATPTTQFDFWGPELDPFVPFQVTAGDEIEASVSLDGAYTLPGATGDRFIRLFFYGADLVPLDPVETSGGIELFNGLTSVLVVPGQGCGTSTALAACVSLGSPGPAPLTFDKVVFSFTINTLNGANPVTVDSALFDTVVTTPVPEPSSWALFSAGLAMAGYAARRRR